MIQYNYWFAATIERKADKVDYHAKIAYINQHMLTKRDVLESLEKYREHCETTQEEGWSENKRNVILDLLERFSYCLNQMHFPDIHPFPRQ